MKKIVFLVIALSLYCPRTFTANGALDTALQQKYGGKLDTTKFKRGGVINTNLQRQRSLFPGGGFIDPEQNLTASQKSDLSYYRKWTQAVQ